MKITKQQFLYRYGPWAVITGASSGIGEEFSYQLSEYGINLVLVARREDRLLSIAEKIKTLSGVEVRIVLADLSGDEYMQVIKNATGDIDVGFLVNSAGFAVTGNFIENSVDSELALLDVNCRAPLMLAHHFANKMLLVNKGGIVFLSSVVAFSAIRGWAGYAASKSYNLLLSETLAYELSENNIDVLTLCPGATNTEFLKKSGLKETIGADVSMVVSKALGALGVKKVLIPGFINKYNVFWSNFLPRRFNAWFSGFMLKKVRK